MDKIKSLYIDRQSWNTPICPDDFLVTIGVKQSNSVYHVVEVKAKPRMEERIIRYYVKVFDSDLMTAIKRSENQQLITLHWYKR